MTSGLVWYVSYGSNMAAARMACYLEGGCPAGGAVTYDGARDPSPPRDSTPVELPGRVFFAGRSQVWGGGVAFYDHDTPGPAAARAYLVTEEQFSDIVAQEMRRPAGERHDLSRVLADGRHALGPGGYETVLHLGDRAGVPMLTFTAPHGAADVEHTRPSPAYLDTIARGLTEAHGWDGARVAEYLACLGAGPADPCLAAHLGACPGDP